MLLPLVNLSAAVLPLRKFLAGHKVLLHISWKMCEFYRAELWPRRPSYVGRQSCSGGPLDRHTNPDKNMSEETRMEAIIPADRAWAVFSNEETGSSQKERIVCWSRLASGDVVGLVMRKNGLVRADSQPGFVSYLDEVKPVEITPARSEEPATDETSRP
jgi:hypothetical protein